MNTPSPKARDRIANVVIISLTIFLAATLAKEYFRVKKPENKSLEGSSLSIRGVDWGAAKQTLLLVLDKDCVYCEQSMPFYRQLAQLAAGRDDIKLLAVVETSAEAGRRYVGANEVNVDVVNWRFREAGILTTPNLLLVGRQGEITKQWVGLLSPAGEADVIDRLLGGRGAAGGGAAAPRPASQSAAAVQAGPHGISLTALRDLMKERRVTLVDLDERESYAAGHIAQAKNIPSDELFIRALNELDRDATVVLYARRYDRLFLSNVQVLKRQGFENVKILEGGLGGWVDAGLPVAAGPRAK